MVETKISAARARVADPAAMMRLLDEVPGANEIRAELRKPYFTHRWQRSMKRSFWITSDGTTAVCLILTGLEVDELVAIWGNLDEYRRRPGCILSANTLRKVIEAEIGLSVEIEN